MVENPELYAAIVANPREDTPRFAYADWLDENGDPERARFIRLQYEIEKLPPIGLKVSKAKKEEEALLKKYGDAWAGKAGRLVTQHRFRRGFVESVDVLASSFLENGERLFAFAPIREVRFLTLGALVPALAASSLLGRVEALAFSSYIMEQVHDSGRLGVLLASPHLASVQRLDLSMSGLDRADAERIAKCPNLTSLVHLDLSWNRITDAGLIAVANSDRLPSLTSFTCRAGSDVYAEGIRVLVNGPLADRLEHLCLAGQRLGNHIATVVAAAARLNGLRTLDLSDNQITDTGVDALANAAHLARLERFILRGHRTTLTATGRERLKKRFGKDVCVF